MPYDLSLYDISSFFLLLLDLLLDLEIAMPGSKFRGGKLWRQICCASSST